MHKLYFVTGNERKLKEARAACSEYDIELEQKIIEIDEIQAHDPRNVSLHKATSAFRHAGCAVVVTDTSWSIPALGGFPGPYMKDVVNWLAPQDFINLMSSHEDRRICFTETIVYEDEHRTKVFSKEFWGVVASAPRGKGDSADQIAEFNGKTLGESFEQGSVSHDPKDHVWNDFAKWYSQHNQTNNAELGA